MSRSGSKTVCDVLGRNFVHPFPARMAPDLALNVVTDSTKSLRILDPMSGSGTVLAAARKSGHMAIGVDMDPLAVLISGVWTTAIDPVTLRNVAETVLATACKTFNSLRECNAYPMHVDEKTKKFISFWFDSGARRQLTSLAMAIVEVHDKKIRDALWCAFSRLIISKSSGASLAMDLSHSRPHKVFKRMPVEPFSKFLSAVEHVARNCIDSRWDDAGQSIQVHKGDARNLSLPDNSIDLVLTSPPYLNAIDYIRCSKFSLVWMGYLVSEMRDLRSTSIGTEVGKHEQDDNIRFILSKINLQPELNRRYKAILVRYINDMRQVIEETSRVLVNEGKAVYVVGNNTVRGTFIRNSLIVEELAGMAGLECIDRHCRELPANRRYLPPPLTQTTALGKRIRSEIVLTMEKV